MILASKNERKRLMRSAIDFAIIGGTGLYALDELSDIAQHTAANRYGTPSSAITTGLWHDRRVAFLTRHGGDHTIAPHRVNYRANIQALKDLGVSRIVAVNVSAEFIRIWGQKPFRFATS